MVTLRIKNPPAVPFWIVYRPGSSRVRKRHICEAAAMAEALRLRKATGLTFYVCRAEYRLGPDDSQIGPGSAV